MWTPDPDPAKNRGETERRASLLIARPNMAFVLAACAPVGFVPGHRCSHGSILGRHDASRPRQTARIDMLQWPIDTGKNGAQWEQMVQLSGPNVTEVAEHVKGLLADDEDEDSRRQRKIDAIWGPPAFIEGDDVSSIAHGSYVWEREELIGSISSADLLSRDEAAGIWPMDLHSDPTIVQMAYVHEADCVGCTWCRAIARATFQLTEEGMARVVQQGESADAIAEAIESCPADCIHMVSRDELEELEACRAEGQPVPRIGHWTDQVARTTRQVAARTDLGPRFPGIEEQERNRRAQWERESMQQLEREARGGGGDGTGARET